MYQKSLSFRRLPLMFWLLASMLLITACENITLADLDGTMEDGKKTTKVQIVTRGAISDAPLYPLHIYAFNIEGTLVAQQHIASESEELFLSLPQQTECKLVAVSANESIYDIPANPTISSIIKMKAPVLEEGATDFARSIAQGYASSHPLQMGFSTVYPTTDNLKVVIQLHYQVASLCVTLNGLPSECSNAYVTVSSPAESTSFQASPAGSNTARIPLYTSASSLTTSTVYLFPTTGTTTFTLTYTDKNGEHSSSVSYLSPLVPGTPYELNGNYDDGNMHLTGSITPSTWSSPVSLSFDFTEGSSTTIGNSEEDGNKDDAEAMNVSTIPQPLTVWNEHVVVAVTDDEGNAIDARNATSANLLLLSLYDWDGMTAANNAASPTLAIDIASGYGEFDLTDGWRIPTTNEGRLLSTTYSNSASEFDTVLKTAGADGVTLTDQKGNNVRYLCEEATKTYSFKNTTISNAGATIKSYHLRLVRTVKVTKQ